MNNFRTELTPKRSLNSIGLKSHVLTFGSCFANSIGDKLTGNKFNCLTNPFGSIYNPVSIHQLLQLSIGKQLPEPTTFLERDGRWLNYNFHSAFSADSKQAVENAIAGNLSSAHDFLKKADYLIITYGTALVFELKTNKTVVANCHKMSSPLFNKYLLPMDEIMRSFDLLHRSLTAFNPSLKIIVTVSPVRHLKETIELNSTSKSLLRLACYHFQQHYDQVDYFPAYELMMDDLRDYRFYEADMIHPNQQAIDYIWNKFSECYFTESTKDFIKQWNDIKAALNHRAFNPEGEAHQKFLRKTLEKLNELNKIANVQPEIDQLNRAIKTSS